LHVLLISGLASGMAAAQTTPKIDVSDQNGKYLIRVEAVLSAPVRDIWAVLTHCTRATDFIPHLESCRILDKDPSGRWDIRENVANPPLLPRVKTILRNDYAPPHSFSYKLVSGDMRSSEGSWSILPSARGAKVIYSAKVEPGVSVPGFLVVSAIKADLPSMFEKLEALSRARARQP
jgi:hypothetical protein